ncbi:unnamed protein product [Macrosiphum euphorbiae]|uniref:Uncharacterized protein n=1 Tax=Macrosiphum euphorbiae TaxID=13131 RepID=A0AAV0WCN3_9HEMI|nr:unnamed protein product [Macrosiphum euphorbiae]
MANSPVTIDKDSNTKINQLVDMVKDLKNQQNKIVVSLNSYRDAIKAQEKKIDLLSTQLTEVLDDNKSLRIKVEQLETKLLDIERTQNTEPLGATAQEKVYSELLDRQSRARNVILFNVPEPSVPDQSQDTSTAKDILNTIGVQTIPVSIHRLGKLSNKPRPLRVTLPNSSDVFEVLRVKRQLLNVSNLNAIRISSDQTLQQRKYFASTMAVLKNRRDSGESDLFIKYINGLPTILKNDRANAKF